MNVLTNSRFNELSSGFTCLLKKGIHFLWDEVTQESFDASKKALISAPLLHLPDYCHNYFMYLVATDTTIAMVLDQDDDGENEYVFYYLRGNLLDIES